MDAWIKALQDFWAGFVAGTLQPLGNWNYFFIAILVMIEGPIATLLAAMTASGGVLKPEWVFVAASVGNLLADVLWYSLGRLGKLQWLIQHGSRLGLQETHIHRLQRGMHAHARKILILAKLTLSFAIPALIAAGMARVPWRRWFTSVFAAEMVWTGGLVFIGYHVTLSLRRLEAGLQIVAVVGIAIFLVLAVRYFLRHRPTVNGNYDSPNS